MPDIITFDELVKRHGVGDDSISDRKIITFNELAGIKEPPIELQTDKEFIFENEDINEPIEDKESRIKELKSQLEVEDKELFVPLNELKKDRQKRFDDRFVKIKELQEQLDEQIRGVQRLEMAIRGFTMALQEEIKGL